MPVFKGVWQLGKKPKMNQLLKETVATTKNLSTGQVMKTETRSMFISPQFDEERGYLWWNQKEHSKSFKTVPFPDEMSMIDRGRMATLAKCILGKSNMLGYKGHGGLRPYVVEQIAKIIKTDVKQAQRFLTRMEKLRIIKLISVPFGERTEIQIYVNPVYFFAGSRLSLNLYLLFQDEMKHHVPDWVKDEFAKVDHVDKYGNLMRYN